MVAGCPFFVEKEKKEKGHGTMKVRHYTSFHSGSPQKERSAMTAYYRQDRNCYPPDPRVPRIERANTCQDARV